MGAARSYFSLLWLTVWVALQGHATMGASRPNVVLITIDTLRSDRLGCYGHAEAGTPNIDRLAAESCLFRTVIAQVPLTLPSHCTILTGTYPAVHQVRDNVGYRLSPRQLTLAELLKAAGYRTAAFVGSYVLHSKFGLNQGFDRYDDVSLGKTGAGIINLNQLERRAGEVVERVISWLNDAGSGPFFIWIHLFDPHDPYSPPAPFDSAYKTRPYDGEIAYSDQQVGRLLTCLKDKSLYAKTLILVTSDHGESFGEHREYTHGYFLYDTTLLVPLIIKPAGTPPRKRVIESQVSTIDIPATLLEMLEIPRPQDVQGRSLVSLMQGRDAGRSGEAYSETYYPAQFGWSPLRAVRRLDSKYIDAPKSEFYDLARDPGELHNLYAQQTARARGMKALLSQYEDTVSGRRTAEAPSILSPEERERLAALGYVSAGTAPPLTPAASVRWPDPKDKLRVFNLVSEAGRAAAQGRCAAAVPMLERILTEEPKMAAAHLLVGRCRYHAEQFASARDSFTRVVESNPENLEALFFVAACDFYLQRTESAEAGLKKVLAQDPVYLPAHKYLGFLYQAKGQTQLAIRAFERAAEIAPDDEEPQAKLGFLLAGQSRFEEAIARFQKAAKINPGNAATHYNLGLAYVQTNQMSLGEKELAEACRLDKRYCGVKRQ